MSSLFKKGSLRRSPSDQASLGLGKRDKPRDRSVSDGAAVEGDAKPKRRVSLASKGKRRLTSLFSSSSLSSYNGDDKASSSRPNLSTSSSGDTTPTRNGSVPHAPPTSSPLASKDLPPDPAQLSKGIEGLAVDAPPAASEGLVVPGQSESGRRSRATSLYSQWELEDVAESSSGEDDAYGTPDEGLSEIGEDEEEAAQSPVIRDHKLGANNVQKGATAETEDVCGTGPSTIHRNKVVSGTTVRQRIHASKSGALSVDQSGYLAQDIESCRECLTLFLTSKMREAEDMILEKDPEGTRLYTQSAHAIISGLKGMMTFDSHDLANALDLCKATAVTASALRKSQDSVISRIGGLVRTGAGVARVKAMTALERHAELVYAEQTLMKAMLAIISGGDWLGLIREALNMRSAHGIYRTLQQYLEDADKGGYDDDIDMDFRSGVLLGTGTSSLMLSLLPGKVLKVAEVFGYAGDRKVALATLMSAGGWTASSEKPQFDASNEGIRRPICDMILLAFHLVVGVLVPVDGIDINAARKILAYNMDRYPDGIFFLYFQARLHITQCEPLAANKSLQTALDLKLEYVQLQHMCLWDYANNHLQLNKWKSALDCFSILKEESNWSRAVYTYSSATCLLELADDAKDEKTKARLVDEAEKLIRQVPTLTKKIAGKSLPIEKLSNRKCRKFESQGRRLFLPGMELAYVYGAIGHSPRAECLEVTLPRIQAKLDMLDRTTPESYGNGNEYWDDFALGQFLKGYTLATARYPPKEATKAAQVDEKTTMSLEEMDREAQKAYDAVIRHAPDVQLDHYIVYHCHYELGRLYARRGDKTSAKQNFDIVMSGKLTETNLHEKKSHGKYSLEGALLLKTHAALQSLNEKD